jgi:hypothetical protein
MILLRPDALTPLLPRKNVHNHRADRDDADHQDCGRQNNHDNASFVVVARAQVDAGNLGLRRQIAVPLRQHHRACGHDAFGRPQMKSRAVMTTCRFPPP